MIRIKNISFKNHYILGDLTLDFTDENGDAVDTIIIAGENGTGKSTILKALYQIATDTVDFECTVTMDISSEEVQLTYDRDEQGKLVIHNQDGKQLYALTTSFQNRYKYPAIYSDVDINFNTKELTSVTSLDVDTNSSSRRSDSGLPTKIKQLLIDIQDQDAQELQTKYNEAKKWKRSTENLDLDNKMQRFIQAFNKMFDDMTFEGVKNINNHKAVLFNKNGESIPLDKLSSGEKQIVYRGCFLLQDVNALKGALVLIDEPEISMHPRWQNKIMDFYKDIFTNDQGIQTSQIVVVTHSPFIIHNDNRRNDKVIVLQKDSDGKVIIEEKTEYYKCDSIEAVQDAFYINNFSQEKSTVYVEGPTDEKYFKKAIEVFEYKDLPFQFSWVGHIGQNGQEVNTGHNAIDKAYNFLVGRNLPIKNFCLKDSDTNQKYIKENNVICFSIPVYENNRIRKGIENALVLDDFDLNPYYKNKKEMSGYGEENNIQVFDKTSLCNAIIELPNEELQKILSHLKDQIDRILEFYEKE